MLKLRLFFKYWLPPIVWMIVIFSASSDSHSSVHSSRIIEPLLRWLFPKISSAAVGQVNFIFRKCCHLTEYAILAMLLWRALNHSGNKLSPWSWPKIGGALLIVFLYGASDEFHQSFVPTRTAHFTDVLIDTTGGAIGLLILRLFCRRRKPKSQT